MTTNTVTKGEMLASWARERSSDELRSFITSRLSKLALEAVTLEDDLDVQA